jgi:hypothetical protein
MKDKSSQGGLDEDQPIDVEAIPATDVQAAGRPNLIHAYFSQVLSIIFHPHQFFAQMHRSGGFVEPALFFGISLGLFTLLEAIGHLAPVVLITGMIVGTIKLVVGTVLLHYILKALGGKGSLEETFRVIAYSKATLLFAWVVLGRVPIGGYAALVYCLYLNVIGCRRVHDMTIPKVAIPIVILGLIGFFIMNR